MSATAAARIVADLRAGRVQVDRGAPYAGVGDAAFYGPVVDATPIWKSIRDADRAVRLYEDHCIAPPWDQAQIVYENDLGNVIAMSMYVTQGVVQRWETAEPIDWDAVRWTMVTLVYLGGWSPTTKSSIPTSGPVHAWVYAIAADGTPLDLHWVQVNESFPVELWTNAQLVLLAALNFMNCRNVSIVEPPRQRSERRQLERIGVQVSTINVFPVGRSTRSTRHEPTGGAPLTSVHGHFAKYGPEYGRELLFGKYAGRFWRPQHARGSAEAGRSEHDYNLLP